MKHSFPVSVVESCLKLTKYRGRHEESKWSGLTLFKWKLGASWMYKSPFGDCALNLLTHLCFELVCRLKVKGGNSVKKHAKAWLYYRGSKFKTSEHSVRRSHREICRRNGVFVCVRRNCCFDFDSIRRRSNNIPRAVNKTLCSQRATLYGHIIGDKSIIKVVGDWFAFWGWWVVGWGGVGVHCAFGLGTSI